MLEEVNADALETVQINETTYDDGSVGFSIELTYPPKEIKNLVRPEVSG